MKKQWIKLHVEALDMAELVNKIQVNADSSSGGGNTGGGDGSCLWIRVG